MARSRIVWLIAGLLFGFSAIALRLTWLQGFQWHEYAAREETHRCPLRYLPAPRGHILARAGEVLAQDLPQHFFVYTLGGIDDVGRVAAQIARAIRAWDGGLARDFPAALLEESLDRLRGLYRERLGSGVSIPPHPWISELEPPLAHHLARWLKKLPSYGRVPGISVAVDQEGGTIWIEPDVLYAGEAGTRRIERRLALPAGSLFGGAPPARGAPTGIAARLSRARALTDRDARQRALDMKRDLLLELPAALRPGAIPFDLVADVVSHPERYPGIRVRESLRREYRRTEAIGNLVGFVEPVARRVEAEEERAEAAAAQGAEAAAAALIILDERRGGSRDLPRLRDLYTFRDLRGEGYLWGDYIGARGVEAAFEARLHGIAGAVQQELDAFEVPVGVPRDGEAPIPGQDVTLSIDLAFSEYLHGVFAEQGVVAGSMLVGVPETGEIFAWITVPGYDPATLHRDWERFEAIRHLSPLLNRPAQAELPPGSTIKVVFALGALDAGVIERGTPYTCNGVYDPRFPTQLRCNNHNARLPLTLEVSEALARSCNCFFYHLGGKRLGSDRIRGILAGYGFGAPTGIELVGERAGILPAAWPELAAIGQGRFAATPLQLFRFFCALANRGAAPVPSILVAERRADAERLDFGEDSIEAVIAGMVEAVEYGTASDSAIGLHDFACAAKTGTAEWTSNGATSNLAWIAGFAPVKAPEIVFVVEVEHTSLHGGDAAGPIAARALEWLEAERGYRFDSERRSDAR
ncbi:MAG: hypothetical protein L0Z55_10250 [Planctomycetes bacterium]|nr:hypothetical protein [Planctomycetota bacterium]